jgi:hypothetical protein
VSEHFDGIPAFSCPVREYRDNCSFGPVAERLIDLVTDCKFGHRESFRPQALRPVRSKYGFFAIGKIGHVRVSDAGPAGTPARECAGRRAMFN